MSMVGILGVAVAVMGAGLWYVAGLVDKLETRVKELETELREFQTEVEETCYPAPLRKRTGAQKRSC